MWSFSRRSSSVTRESPLGGLRLLNQMSLRGTVTAVTHGRQSCVPSYRVNIWFSSSI